MSDWLPPRAPGAGEPPRFERAPEAPPEAVQPPTVEQQHQQQPVFVQPSGAAAANNGVAVAALVLGIVALALLLFSLGTLFIFTIPMSAGAWACGYTARKRLAAGTATGGEGQAKAGRILGIIGVVLGVVAMIAWIALIASGVDLDELQRDLERELERQENSNDEFATWAAALRALWP